MFESFRRRVGAKIILGYLASMSLMVISAGLVASGLTQIMVTVRDLANSQAVDVELSNAMVNHIALARFHAHQYMTRQDQADMDAYQASLAQLRAVLAQTDQKPTKPERVELLRQINADVEEYNATFDQITTLLLQRQRIKAQVLDVQELVLENRLTALRINLSANDPAPFLSYGNAQNAFQAMRLNVLQYLASGDARYVVLFDKGRQQAQEAFSNLQTALTDPAQLSISASAQADLIKYAQGFQVIQMGYVQLKELTQTKLDTLGHNISQAASEIASQSQQDFEASNVSTRAFVAQTQLVLLMSVLGAILIGLLLGWHISRGITMPLQQVARTAQQIANVDLKTMSSELVSLSDGKLSSDLRLIASPLAVKSKDEVGQMAQAFNEIIFSLHRAEQAFRNMTAYLNEMASVAQNVARGSLDVSVAVRSPDDVLGNALAQMVHHLSITEENLRRHQDHLQELVQERTQTLRESEQRYRALYITARRQAQDMTLLDQVRTAVARELDLPGVIRTVVEGIAQTFGYPLVSLYMRRGDVMILQHQVGYDQVIPEIPIGKGVLGKVVRTGQPMLLKDVCADPDFLAAVPGVTSEVCVPLFDRDTVVGALNIEGRQGVELTEADLPLLTALSEYISVALGRARLYTQIRENEERYRLLFYQSPVGIIHFDPQLRITDCNDQIASFLQLKREGMIGVDLCTTGDQSVLPALRQALAGMEGQYEGPYHVAPDSAIVWILMRTAPLFDERGQVRGGIAIVADITERKQVEEYIVRLNDLKQQLIGIRSLDEKLKLVTDGGIDIFGADLARVWLIQEADLCEKGCRHAAVTEGPDVCRSRTRCLHLVASSGRYPRVDGDHRRVPLGSYKIGRIATGEDAGFVTNEVTHDPRIHDHQWARSLGLVSFAGYRLVSGDGKPIGVLALFGKQPVVSDEARLLESLANTASQVILAGVAEQALARRAREMAALYETTLEINSQPDVPTLLQAVVRRAADLLGVRMGGLYLVTPDGQTLELVVSHNMPGHFVGATLRLGEGLSGRVAQTGELTMVNDYLHYEGRMALYDDIALRRVLAVPLKVGDRVIGVLNINDDVKTSPFDEEEVRLASLFADQAASAVERARLYQAEREQHELAETLREVGAALTSTLDVDTVLNRILEQVCRVVPNDTASVLLIEGDLAYVARGRGYERFGSQAAAAAMRFSVSGTPSLQQMAATGQSLVIPDVRAYPGWSDRPELAWIRSSVGAPVRVQGQVIGFLSVDSATPGFFTPKHAERLRAFADQAAIAVQNARLYAAVQQELAERKRIEAELRSLNNRFELYLKYIPIPMYVKDADTRAVILSRHFEQMLGKPIRELIGKTNAELWPPELAGPMTLDDERVIQGDQVVTTEETFQGQHYYSFKFPIKEPDQPPLLGGYTIDITELKQTQEALRESDARMRQITAAMQQAVWLRDTRTLEVLYVNPAYEQIWGRTCESLIANPTSFIEAIHPDDKERILEAIQRQYQDIAFNQEYRIIRPDGSIRWVWGRTFPIQDGTGQVYRVLAVVEDITERKLMQVALLQAKDAAEAASRTKSIFLANMSHELRTPLNAILGFSNLMARDTGLFAEQRENLAIINHSGEHLLSLINDVLDMAKIESGRMTAQEEAFDLHHLLDELVEMFRQRATEKGLTLIMDRAPNVPRYVQTDVGKLRQILINLLGNAIKFTEAGGIGLRVRMSGEASPSERPAFGQFEFEVQDTGPGIAPQDLETVFEPFVQAASGLKSQQGTGLGLPISRQFARLMGGELTVESSGVPGQGALFRLQLPVELAEAADLPGLQKPERFWAIGLEPGQHAADGGPFRLLVVEDREESRKLLVKLLTQFGFEVRAAANGLEGVNVWREWQPHLIWMDMRMPVMDGHEATQCIKATRQGQATVIIALTATAFEDQRELVLSEGCDGFVRKPFRESDIVDVLVEHLGVRFIYEGEPAIRLPDTPPQGILDFAGLPADWTADLKQAATEANTDRMLALVEQIREQQPELASALVDRINSFDLDAILRAIGSVGSQK